MMSQPLDRPPSGLLSRESLAVLALTLAGAIVRFGPMSSLGLDHFDEGIYALAGLWPFARGGLAALDPTVIAYAPPGFPVLVGLSYLFLGVSDVAAILGSLVAGTLTVPATAWLARRTFGPGAGVFAAALLALSGYHVAYSRMALTDASFLLFWTLGLIAAQRFLEKPGVTRGIVLGLAVGLAQLFKYNGWLIGAVTIAAAALGPLVDATERGRQRLRAIWGAGLLAAVVAALVYAPWFLFVQRHGGYGRLLAHHQGYMGGPATWLPHLRLQLAQVHALSIGRGWMAGTVVLAFLLFLAVVPRRLLSARAGALGLPSALVFGILPQGIWLAGGVWILISRRWTVGTRLLAVAWYVLSALTPFYHPYARLWFPLQMCGWLAMAGLVRDPAECDLGFGKETRRPGLFGLFNGGLVLLGLVVTSFGVWSDARSGSETIAKASPPVPGSSLRTAVEQVVSALPRDTSGLRVLARPSVTFYLNGRVPLRVEPDVAGLEAGVGSGQWALVDTAQLRQEGNLDLLKKRLLNHWEIMHLYPTRLSLPTLLDVDPAAAFAGNADVDEAPLWLLRPRSRRTAT